MLVDWVAYLGLLGFTLFIWSVEHKDIRCPNFEAPEQECDLRGGMAFSDTRPINTDSCQQLFEKIYKAAGTEQRSIKWRKAFVLAVGITFVGFILLYSSTCTKPIGMIAGINIPGWQTLYLTVLLTFVILMGTFTYYSYHVYGAAESWEMQALDMLKSKDCLKN
jgi:hypothetical protein